MANKPELKRAVAGSKIKANDYNYNFEQLNNYIENGIADNAISNYEPDREYKKGQWVLAEVDGSFGLYESLVDGNKGSSLTDENYWKKVTDDEVDRIVGKIEEIEEEIAKIPTLIPDNSALIASYGMPSTTSEDITGGASGATYTAQGNGYVYVYGTGAAASTALYLDNTTRNIGDFKNGANGNGISVIIPVLKGDVFTMGWYGVYIGKFKFIYLEGEVK